MRREAAASVLFVGVGVLFEAMPFGRAARRPRAADLAASAGGNPEGIDQPLRSRVAVDRPEEEAREETFHLAPEARPTTERVVGPVGHVDHQRPKTPGRVQLPAAPKVSRQRGDPRRDADEIG